MGASLRDLSVFFAVRRCSVAAHGWNRAQRSRAERRDRHTPAALDRPRPRMGAMSDVGPSRVTAWRHLLRMVAAGTPFTAALFSEGVARRGPGVDLDAFRSRAVLTNSRADGIDRIGLHMGT